MKKALLIALILGLTSIIAACGDSEEEADVEEGIPWENENNLPDFDQACITGFLQQGAEEFVAATIEGQGDAARYRMYEGSSFNPTTNFMLTTWAEGQNAGPSKPGNFEIRPVDEGMDTCGLCISATSYDGSEFAPVAGSGGIAIEEIGVGEEGVGQDFTAEIALAMQEVTIDFSSGATTPVTNGKRCWLTHSFSGTMTAPPAL